MFKLFSKKRKLNEMSFLIDCLLEDVDDILEDIDDLIILQEENNKLVTTIQEQCQQIIEKMEKNNDRKDERTLEEIVDNIENIISNMENKNNGEEDKDVQDR